MNTEEELELVGLSGNEAKVYHALIKLGSAPVSQIAAKADIHRVNIYDALRRLAEKGLVSSVTKAEKLYFEAASPDALQLILDKREEELQRVRAVIPQLTAEYDQRETKQEVHHYKGKRGLITMYENALSVLGKGEVFYSLGATGIMREMLDFYIGAFNRKRVEKGIWIKALYYEQARGKQLFKLQKRRFIPKNLGFLPVTMYIYRDTVAIVSFDELLGVEIISQKIADAYRKYFDWLWSISSP